MCIDYELGDKLMRAIIKRTHTIIALVILTSAILSLPWIEFVYKPLL
jgi:hypothetical protein